MASGQKLIHVFWAIGMYFLSYGILISASNVQGTNTLPSTDSSIANTNDARKRILCNIGKLQFSLGVFDAYLDQTYSKLGGPELNKPNQWAEDWLQKRKLIFEFFLDPTVKDIGCFSFSEYFEFAAKMGTGLQISCRKSGCKMSSPDRIRNGVKIRLNQTFLQL